MRPTRDEFIKTYAAELSASSRYDAGALELQLAGAGITVIEARSLEDVMAAAA